MTVCVMGNERERNIAFVWCLRYNGGMTSLLTAWQHCTTEPGLSTILPDGCRDVIGYRAPDGAFQWMITEVDSAAYCLLSRVGEAYVGFRMRPGTTIHPSLIEVLLDLRIDPDQPSDQERLMGVLDQHCQTPDHIVEILNQVAKMPRVSQVASRLGVAERTLSRTLTQSTGKAPQFWRQLGQARAAARLLVLYPEMMLSDLAAIAGYADQAHMTRAFRRWFGVTPGAFSRRADLQSMVMATGFVSQLSY